MKKDRKLKEKWDIPKKGDTKMKKEMLSNICIIIITFKLTKIK